MLIERRWPQDQQPELPDHSSHPCPRVGLHTNSSHLTAGSSPRVLHHLANNLWHPRSDSLVSETDSRNSMHGTRPLQLPGLRGRQTLSQFSAAFQPCAEAIHHLSRAQTTDRLPIPCLDDIYKILHHCPQTRKTAMILRADSAHSCRACRTHLGHHRDVRSHLPNHHISYRCSL
jgi:hypothetical protein